MIHRFDLWMESVNSLFRMRFNGLEADDFEDYLWHDFFASGLLPKEAFEEWLEDNEYD